ncbi:PP2C family protein-serine/threonine phosphatase [Streptomyces sp. NPDC090445]|uniref:PP2C family protein-serine/threonine phosphatase n=1 Tax=Streptomyces sp. NPDC090445 TaxID=3365963 RepID=UPI0037F11D56
MDGGQADVHGALARALRRSHHIGPGEVAGLVVGTGRELGLSGVRILLADVQQRRLVPLTGGAALDIDGSLAGLAYRTQRVQRESGGGRGCWVPMADGIERLGVLYAAPDEGRAGTGAGAEAEARAGAGSETGAGAETEERADALATLATLLLVSKSTHDDGLITAVRSRPMSHQAELVWAILPPRTIGSRRVTSSAVLEPAYDVGGDAFDHSFDGDVLQLAVLDAMGHDLASGGASAIALAACRAARRDDTEVSGGSGVAALTRVAQRIEEALTRWIPDRLLTGVLARLDTMTGRLAWVNCGHPPPLLIRDGRVVPHALERTAQLPLGLGAYGEGREPAGHTVRLQPGDRVLVHTDGVTEARSPDGETFGEQRLTDIVVRSMAAGEAAPEALRRLVLSLLDHQAHELRDDATILLTEWHPQH